MQIPGERAWVLFDENDTMSPSPCVIFVDTCKDRKHHCLRTFLIGFYNIFVQCLRNFYFFCFMVGMVL